MSQTVQLYAAPSYEASWRNGYAEDCKSLNGGSIPSEASNLLGQPHFRSQSREAALEPADNLHCRPPPETPDGWKINRQNQ